MINTLMRVLKNPFYSGVIEYRKEYVPDYLEQKKVLNHGEVDKIVVQGKHKPIVTKEDFSERQLAIKRDISSIESEIMRLKTIPQMDGVDVREKMNTLKGALEEQLDFENQGIPDSFIDMFVDEIKVCEGNRCEWKLNLTDLAIGFTTEGSKKKPEIRLEIH